MTKIIAKEIIIIIIVTQQFYGSYDILSVFKIKFYKISSIGGLVYFFYFRKINNVSWNNNKVIRSFITEFYEKFYTAKYKEKKILIKKSTSNYCCSFDCTSVLLTKIANNTDSFSLNQRSDIKVKTCQVIVRSEKTSKN